MSDRIYAATRKGLFVLDRVDGKWNISSRHFLGNPIPMVLHDPRDNTLYATIAHGHFGVKLHRSSDGGETWEEGSVPVYPDPPEGEDKNLWTLHQIWILEAAGADDPGAIWAGTIPGGLFRSTDRGASWVMNTALWEMPERKEWFGGGYDYPGIHSIDVDPRNSSRLALGVSCGGVWATEDRGETWTNRTKGMWAAFMPPERREDPNIQDPHRVVRCQAEPDCLWAQHHNGVFKTTNEGEQWEECENVPPAVFGFTVAVHPKDPNTAWLVPAVKDECRIPVDGQVVVARTRDGGESWTVLREGLPQRDSYDLVYRHGLDVDSTGERLVMGSTTGSLWISEDQGESWETLSTHLPPVFAVRFGS